MEDWITKNKETLWEWISECFVSVSDCDNCPCKKECDAIWKTVKR